jgi:hypothetical protein
MENADGLWESGTENSKPLAGTLGFLGWLIKFSFNDFAEMDRVRARAYPSPVKQFSRS